MDLVSSRNIEEMVMLLKKEVSKTHNVEHEDTGKYRQLLVRTLHQACIKFPDVAGTVIPVLMEFLSDTNELAASDVLIFVREAIYRFDNLKMLILEVYLISQLYKFNLFLCEVSMMFVILETSRVVPDDAVVPSDTISSLAFS